MKRLYSLILLLVTLLFGACSDPKHVIEPLHRAEALMNEHPDSALNLLKGIAQPELKTQEHRARYALLYSQALDKNFIDLTSDSLINIAVDYYKDRDDVRAKFLSYYYQGRIYTNANNLTQATLAYLEAEQLVDELGDGYAAGLLYKQIGLIYNSYYDFPKGLQAHQQAIEHFTKANKPVHRIQAMLTLSNIHRNMHNENIGYEVLRTAITESQKLNDQSLIKSCINNLILVCIDLERWEEATQWYQEYQKNNSRNYPTVAFYGYIARLHAKNKNFKDAFMLLDETWKKTKSLQDSINLFHAESQVHQMNGSWEESYRSMAKSISHQNKVIRKSLQQPVLTAQNNFLNQELELQKYKAQSERQMRIIGVVLTILLVVAAVYGVSVYIKRQREKYLKQIRKQVARIELLKDEKNGMEEEVRKLNQLLSQGGELKDELMQAKGEWTRLEDIRALELYTRLRQDPSLYNPSADYDALLRWVDIASVRFAERLQESYPHLNVSEITLCCLVRMGYSPSQMAEILHVKIPTVNRYIYRICTSLELPNHKESFKQFIVAF
jgi:DNA-binding CsgD family transcriptional regulator/cell division protein FtsB